MEGFPNEGGDDACLEHPVLAPKSSPRHLWGKMETSIITIIKLNCSPTLVNELKGGRTM